MSGSYQRWSLPVAGTAARLIAVLLAAVTLILFLSFALGRTSNLTPILAYVSSEESGSQLALVDLHRRITTAPGRILPPVKALAWSADGDTLAFIAEQHLYILNTALWTAAPHSPIYTPLAGTPAISWLSDTRLALWDSEPFHQINSIILIQLFKDGSAELSMLTLPREVYGSSLAWSPDRRRLALTAPDHEAHLQDPNASADADIYLTDFDGDRFGPLQQLTDNRVDDEALAWSPNGKQLAFVSYLYAHADIFVIEVESPEQVYRITDRPIRETHPSWSPDGKYIAYDSGRGGDPADIMVIDGEGEIICAWMTSGAHERMPQWSPEGSIIVFQSYIPGLRSADLHLIDTRTCTSAFLVSDTALRMIPHWRPLSSGYATATSHAPES
jgi:dipeptidyl aminopeptidase/acylaminoacyl peptidase